MQLLGRSWDLVEIQLAVTFIKNVYISIFFILKILTDFRKTVETGMDPRLHSVYVLPKEG